MQIVPQRCHGILQTCIPSESTFQGLSDTLYVAWVHTVAMKIWFKYLKRLISTKVQIALQWCHGILQTYVLSESAFQGLSDALYAVWVCVVAMKIDFKYLKGLTQHNNVNSATTVPWNSTDLYTIWKHFLRAFRHALYGMGPYSGHEDMI